MLSQHKNLMILIWVVVFSLTGIISSHAGSGSNQPGTTPTPKYLPDLKPVSLFFDKDCNLMVKIKNVGKGKFVGPRTGFRFFMDGGFIGGAFYNLILFPNSTVTKMVSQKALLGVWVEKTKSWRYVVNEKGPIQGSSAIYVEESDDTNNSITKEIMCKVLPLPKDLRERLPETKPPMPPTPIKKNLKKMVPVQPKVKKQ